MLITRFYENIPDIFTFIIYLGNEKGNKTTPSNEETWPMDSETKRSHRKLIPMLCCINVSVCSFQEEPRKEFTSCSKRTLTAFFLPFNEVIVCKCIV